MIDNGRYKSEAAARNQWLFAFALLLQNVRTHVALIIILALVFAMGGAAMHYVLPKSYSASSELLIDPRGLQVFENELVAGQYDANAAVNYVESQIHVILSSAVLVRALQYLEEDNTESPASATAQDETSARSVSSSAIDALRSSISVTRAERSYLLTITGEARTPQEAADFTNAVVRAYLDEESASRTRVAQGLTDKLESRLAQLRERLTESEQRAETFRQQNNLVTTDDGLIVDTRLAAAVAALSAADERLSAMRVRHQQILSSDLNAAIALAEEPEQLRLNILVERRAATREELAELSAQFGSLHPALRNSASKVQEVDELIEAELEQIRRSSETAMNQMRQERDNLRAVVDQLTQQSAASRVSLIELRALEAQVESDRQLLSSFEKRSREINEFARIDSANVRVLSEAYPPEANQSPSKALALAIAGGLIGAMIGAAWAVVKTTLNLTPAEWDFTQRTDGSTQTGDQRSGPTPQARAELFPETYQPAGSRSRVAERLSNLESSVAVRGRSSERGLGETRSWPRAGALFRDASR